MIPRAGVSGSDIPIETQMLLLEVREESISSDEPSYILFLPVLDGKFRSSLQGNLADELELCIESGNFSSSLMKASVAFCLQSKVIYVLSIQSALSRLTLSRIYTDVCINNYH